MGIYQENQLTNGKPKRHSVFLVREIRTGHRYAEISIFSPRICGPSGSPMLSGRRLHFSLAAHLRTQAFAEPHRVSVLRIATDAENKKQRMQPAYCCRYEKKLTGKLAGRFCRHNFVVPRFVHSVLRSSLCKPFR